MDVRGFEKPRVQWMVIGLCAVLTILLIAATVRMRALQNFARSADQVLRTNEKERQALERDLARERSAREALTLELARGRSGAGQPGSPSGLRSPSTLTLDPTVKRTGAPPESTVEAPLPDGVIELRLQLPDSLGAKPGHFQITARDWSSGASRWTIGSSRIVAAVGKRAACAYVTGEMLAPGAYEILLTSVGEGGPQPDAVAAYELAINRRATR